MRILITFIIGFLVLPSLPTSSAAEENTQEKQELSLTEAVRLALANNLGLQLQKDDVEAAQGARQAAEGEFDVLVSGEGGAEGRELIPAIPGLPEEEESAQWSAGLQKKFITGTEVSLNWKNSRFSSTPPAFLFDPAYNSTLTLGVRQPLLQGFGIKRQTAGIRASEKNLEASSLLVGAEAANLAARVRAAYWNLVYAWQDKSVKELSLTLAQRLLEETDAKIRAGKLAEVDIYQPRSEISRREEGLISADRTIGLHEDELKLLMNTKDWQATIIPTDLPPTEPYFPELTTILENALRNRPDIKAADLSIDAARIREESARDNTRPSLDLVGLLGQGGTDEAYGDSIDDAIDDGETQWQAGLAFSMPLQNNVAKGLYRQAGAAHSKARNTAEQMRLEVQQSVRTTVRDVQLAIKGMEATKKTSLATQKRLEAEQAKFAAGRATTFDVLAAQEAYSQALSQEKLIEVAYAVALAELDRLQGLVPSVSSN
jgi:outer membrane protein TolC